MYKASAIQILLVLCITTFFSCQQAEKSSREDSIREIAAAEKAFEQLAAEKGIAYAFAWFADSSAVIKRGEDSLIRGIEGIRHFYSDPYFKNCTVKWNPEHIEASGSGDMGYTWGHYEWTHRDSAGFLHIDKGLFHTVWKRQQDGSWKYTWD